MYAHGVENRFADWSLDRVFGDLRRLRDGGAVAAIPSAEIRDRGDAPQAAARRLRHHRIARLPLGVERPARHAPQPARLPRAVPRSSTPTPSSCRVGSGCRIGPARRSDLDLAVAHGAGPALEECRLSSLPRRRDRAARPAAHRGAGGARSRQRSSFRVPDLAEAVAARGFRFELHDADGRLDRAQPSRPCRPSAAQPRRRMPATLVWSPRRRHPRAPPGPRLRDRARP